MTRAVLHRIRRAPAMDHFGRALARYLADSSDRHAASITYYAYLMVFPLLLLVVSVVGFLVRGDAALQAQLLSNIQLYIPGDLADSILRIVTERAGTTGVLGLLGLAFAGLGWVDTLRECLRLVWHQELVQRNIIRKKLSDLGILLALLLTLLGSLAITTLGARYAQVGLRLLGFAADDPTSQVVLRLVSLVLSVATDVALLSYLFLRLPQVSEPLRRVLRGALFGAVGLQLLKFAGIYYLDRFTYEGARVYGATLAAGLGLLIWTNVLFRFLLFTAAWTVTAPYRQDVEPSGTADQKQVGRSPEGKAPGNAAPEPAPADTPTRR